MIWDGHVAYIAKRTGAYNVCWGCLRVRDYLEDQGIDGRIILKWLFTK
jgi:hypothetical protein